jgi:hypothetical protein
MVGWECKMRSETRISCRIFVENPLRTCPFAIREETGEYHE